MSSRGIERRFQLNVVRLLGVVLLTAAVALGAGAAIPSVDTEPERQARPRVGLALGGGGARGLAHIGVLRWLEAHRVPVDVVAGTSMGGLVGGAYATGIDADSLAALIHALDWSVVLSPSPPYRRLIMRRKQDHRAIPGGVELSFSGGLATSTGLVGGHYIDGLLSRIALDHSAVVSFDDLPIPFRCVALDLVSGAEVVLDHAPLDRALRATMAIPGIFTAVALDSMLLVDGGLVNNVPADVVRAMGADIVIAVDVGETLDPDAEIRSVTAAFYRAQIVTSRLLTDPRLADADVLVEPDLDGYTISSFHAADTTLAARGYAAMEAVAERVLPVALDETAWRAHLEARRARRRTAGIGAVGEITLRGAARGDSLRATREIRRKVGDGPLDTDALEDALTDLYGWGKYEAFDYRRTPDGSGMIVEAHPVAQGPPYLRLGLEIDGSDADDPELAVKSRLIVLDPTGFGSEMRFNVRLGSDSRVDGEWYQPVAGPLFASAHLYWAGATTYLYAGEERLAEYRRRVTGVEASWGIGVVSRSQETRVGYRHADERNKVRTGDRDLPGPRGGRDELFVEWALDTRNDPVLADRGIRVEATGSRFFDAPGGRVLFYRAHGRLEAALPLDARHSLLVRSSFGTTFEDPAPLFLDFTLGGPFRFGALHEEEIRGSRLAYGALGAMRRLSEGFVSLRALLAVESGSVWEPGGTESLIYCGTAMMIAETPLGPAILGGSAGEGRVRVYFTLAGTF